MAYNLSEPIMIIFDAVNDQYKLRDLVSKPYTPSQFVDFAFLVISNHQIFRGGVRGWLRRLPIDQIYPDLVAFFQEVQAELRKTEASVDELRFQLTSTIVAQIFDQLRTEMGSINPMEDGEPPIDIPPPIDSYHHVSLVI